MAGQSRWTSGLRSILRAVALLCALAGWGALSAFSVPSHARADDLSDFEAARSLYAQQAYARAVDAFRLLVGSDPPRLNHLLVLESRKYLAASLLFMGAEAEARTQFRLLLRQEPSYALDPLAFPTDVFTQFEQVKQDLRDELAKRIQEEQRELRRAQEEERERERLRLENLARLRAMASTGESRERNSRWIATVPFGVGQFQNGDKGLGVALGMLQGLAATSSVVSYVSHERLADDEPSSSELRSAQSIERAWRNANIASFSVFVALAIIGIIDAHVRFVPERVNYQPRRLPPDLDRWLREQSKSAPSAAGGVPLLRF
jgi:hypothetical protein